MNATTVIFAALSPLLVALLRRCSWPQPVVELVSFLVVVAIYLLGQWLDQALTWPLTSQFWVGLGAAWAAQQAAYKFVMRGSRPIEQLESFGDGSPQA